MLSFEEARQRIVSAVPRLPVVTVPFTEAAGHVLAREIVARDDLPPWPNSAMDGFAVRSADLAGAAPEHPAALRLIGDLPAGRAPVRAVGTGEAMRIMTGAPLPEGADSVVIVEEATTDGGKVLVRTATRPGQHVRQAGENVSRGEAVLEEGTPLRAAEIGLLASLGETSVAVYQKPVVAVFSCGDELVPPDRTPGPGQIRDSNRFALTTHLERLGFPTVDFGSVPDSAESIEALFRHAATGCDVLVSTGGVSVGDFDLTRSVLERLGTMNFWKVAIRPGKPLAFGFIDGRPVFGLPGNPVSCLVVLDQLVRPALRRMAGYRQLYRPVYRATLEEPLRHGGGDRLEFVRAVVRYENGRFFARSTGPQDSNILKSLALANGLMMIPPRVGNLSAGDTVECQLFAEDM